MNVVVDQLRERFLLYRAAIEASSRAFVVYRLAKDVAGISEATRVAEQEWQRALRLERLGGRAIAELLPALLARVEAYITLEDAAAEVLGTCRLIAPHGAAVVVDAALVDELSNALDALRAPAAGEVT